MAGAETSESLAAAAGPILVVDDDPNIRVTIQWALEEAGFRVETAADGIEALERAARVRPVLVVLDLRLPGVDGANVAIRLRADHGSPPPILLVTAEDRAASTARRVGAYAYLGKPFDLDDLVETVRRGLDGARS
jgi:DNA-binding response OmpR family regulator